MGDAPPESAALSQALEDCLVFYTDLTGAVTRWVAGAHSAGQHYAAFFTAWDQARGWPERMLEWARSSPRVKDEGWRLRGDDQRFWAEHVIAPVRDSAGELTGFAHAIFDSDRRLNAERAVTEADRRILEYQHIAELGTFEVDPSTGDFLVTPETLRIMGLVEASGEAPAGTADFVPLPAKELFQHVHSDDVARLYFAPQSPQPVRIRIRIARTGGEMRTVELRSHPIQDREGVVVRRLGTIQDVTRLLAEKNAVSSER